MAIQTKVNNTTELVTQNNNVNQSVNEAVNRTGSELPEILNLILGSPVNAITSAIILLGLIVMGVMLYIYFIQDEYEEEEFETESLESITLPEIKNVVQKYGKKPLQPVHRDLMTVGELYKAVRFTEKGELYDDDLDENNFEKEDVEPEADEDDLRELYNQGIYSFNDIQSVVNDHAIPHRLFMIRPNDFFGKLSWAITDGILNLDKSTDYMLIPEHMIKQNPDGSISIARSMELRPFCGLEVPLYYETFGILHSVVMRNLYKQSLEGQVNYFKKLNFFDSQFSQRMQRLEKEADIEKAKYNSGVAGDVNKS